MSEDSMREWLITAYDSSRTRCITMQHVPATLLEHLAHFTECQLATVEGLRLLKRPSKTELSRHESIAIMMLTACYRYGLTRLAARDQDYGRVADALALLAEHRARSFKPEDEAK